VYNGIDASSRRKSTSGTRCREKVVLFLGRLTMQKGPEYFLAVAKKVLTVMDNVKFIVAGSGVRFHRTVYRAAEMGIGHNVLFAGFLRGDDVTRAFGMADLYVMPSVTEPFGIAPLEAISHGVPVIISKSSGVSEVLEHALKVDFWDVEEMANKIVAVLRHPPLASTLRENASAEIRQMTWDKAAGACLRLYHLLLRSG
jgi:glycosyltransferase involved in cell wall biosynthesis